MRAAEKSPQCYVCEYRYAPEDLGRVNVLDFPGRKGFPVFRVICKNCYSSMQAWYEASGVDAAPPLHGF